MWTFWFIENLQVVAWYLSVVGKRSLWKMLGIRAIKSDLVWYSKSALLNYLNNRKSWDIISGKIQIYVRMATFAEKRFSFLDLS